MVIFEDNEAEAEVFKVTQAINGDNIYHLKVGFPDQLVWFNNVKVRRSMKKRDEWWVQLFSYKPRNRWLFPTEMSYDSPFYKLIEAAAIKAVEDYRDTHGEDENQGDEVV